MNKEQIEQAFREKYPYAIDAMKEAFIAGAEYEHKKHDYEYYLKQINLIIEGFIPTNDVYLNEINYICKLALGYDMSEGDEND